MSKSNNVKYIAPIGNSGYAEAAKDYMVSLHKAGVNVTYQCFNFDNTDSQNLGHREVLIKSLINKKIDYNTVIIHSTPEHWPDKVRENKGKKIIGMTVWETTKLHPEWVSYINQVHHVIVPCEWNKKVFQESGVTSPITVIPHILKEQNNVDCEIDGIKDRYVFYTIGQWHNRKGVGDTIRAYLMAFTSKDLVALVVKTFSSDFSEGQQIATRERVKSIIREYQDPARVILVDSELNQNQVEAIHTVGDCYVSMCKSEGWGLGAFDAAGRGKPVIMTGFGGQMDFLKKGQHRIVNFNLIDAVGMPWIPWYLPEQKWAQPDLEKGASFMRQVYETQAGVSTRQANWMFNNFKEETVIKKLKSLI